MTRVACMCRRQDDGLKIWFAPRREENEKPCAESERAQRWRLSLASLLFIAVLLSDHLWFCAEAKLTRTRDKARRSDRRLAFTDTGAGGYPNSLIRHHPHQQQQHDHHRSSSPPAPHSRRSRETDDIFIGNSTKPLDLMDTCRPDGPESRGCLNDTEPVCAGLSSFTGNDGTGTQLAPDLGDLYLSFCNSYSLLDLFHGFRSPREGLNCSLDMVAGLGGHGDARGCTECVRAYRSHDRRAEDDYRDFELLVQKYETDAYSVRSCMEECKTVYKPWLCSQFFRTSQRRCSRRLPCAQYCLEVQQRCPFILPDNDDLIHGGSPSFICTGLLEDHPTGADPDAMCCDVRWDPSPLRPDNNASLRPPAHPSCPPRPSLAPAPSPSSPPPPPAPSSSATACRLSGGRLRLCLLVLVLLHTVASLASAHNATNAIIPPLEESSANEE